MANADWNINAKDASSFGTKGRIITPSADLLDPPAKGVVMLAEGDITIVPINSTTPIPFVGVSAGYIPPYIVGKVTACTSSCATID